MNSATHACSSTTEVRDATDEPAEDPARFYADIIEGLHAIAQPLTILRAAMEVLALPERAAIDQRRYLDISTKQVERTCNLFSCLQDLVAAKLNEAQAVRFDLWEVLSPMIEDRRASLQASGIGIVVARHEPEEPVVGDVERTEQAVAEVLKMAESLSSRGDVIELHASRAHGFCELTLQNTRGHGKRMSSPDRLGLSLAAMNIVSQRGRYRFEEDPFCVSLALPVQESGE